MDTYYIKEYEIVLYKMDFSHNFSVLEGDADKVTQFHHTYSYCV